ncbi:MAG: type VI secretion system contractile sheath small subunit, partial [Planctomycetes bacterium]|nr:type VI secretion system contractile sheath small subunit [Planctomycetota bacterium]
AMADSSQDKTARNQPPRVHLSYKVETEGATQEKELPFVVGVVGDFAGNSPEEKLPPISKRAFTEIDAFNYDEVMSKLGAGLSFTVDNALANDDSQFQVDLKIRNLADFNPENVARQVGPVAELLAGLLKLKELRLSVQGDEAVKAELGRLIKDMDAGMAASGDAPDGKKDSKPSKKK